VIGIIYVKRGKRLRPRQTRLDGPGPGADATTKEAGEARGTFTNLTSKLHTLLTISSPKQTVPPVRPHILNDRMSTQTTSTRRRYDSEGKGTLVEMVEVMHRLQERVAYLEGRSSGNRAPERGLRRTSTPSQSEATSRSDDTSDPPPTYES
jgi:hypothetical protein